MRRGWKRSIGKRPQRAFFDQPGNLLQHLASQFFVTVENRIHGHDVERRVVAQRPKRDARVLVNVAFADLDEAAEFGETGETHRDRFPGERVQNDVHSLAIGQLQHRLGKIAASRVDHVFDSERFEQSTFTRAAGGGDDFRAKMQCDLDRGHSDSTRARVNKNALALAQSRHVSQRMPRGHEDDG